MNRAERICKLSVCMRIRGYIRTSAFVHKIRGTYEVSLAVSTFGTTKRMRDFQKGEPWFTSLAPCRRHAPQRLSLRKNKLDAQHNA